MAHIQAQYDEVALENPEELDKYWSYQIEESTTVFTLQTTEIGAAETALTEVRRMVQSLEIDLDSMRNLTVSLENSLKEVETRYAMQMEQLSGICCTWSQSWSRPWQRGNARPRSTSPC